jgi:lysine-specific demethylase 8
MRGVASQPIIRSQYLDRIAPPSPQVFYKEYICKNRPVVLTNLIDRWPARSKWTPDYFRETYGDVPVPIEVWDDAGVPAHEPGHYLKHARKLTLGLGEYVDLVCATKRPSRKYYLAQLPVSALPGLPDDLDLTSYQRYSSFPRPRDEHEPLLWLGPAGTVSTLHFDMSSNFLAQLHGRKQLILFSPDQAQRLYYPWPAFGDGCKHFSPIEVERPDLERFPRFAEAEALDVVLGPGDVLFLPSGWWHYVKSLDTSITLTYWFS